MTFQTVVGGSDDFRRFNEDRGLEPVVSPATVHRPGFIPALVLPGSDQHVLQEGLKGSPSKVLMFFGNVVPP